MEKNTAININIGKDDLIWSYLSTFLQIGSGILLFPLILRMLSSETVGIWAIFTTIFTFISILDFGFSPSFTRNITYIFSGVDALKKTGISNEKSPFGINMELLANTIKAMKWLYARIGLAAFFLLSTAGTYYLHTIVKTRFSGDEKFIIISWILFCIISTYNIYTLYYDSLLMGRGLVKKNKKIIVFSQILYLGVAVLLLLSGFDLVSIVLAQFISILAKRILSYRTFFTPSLKSNLARFDAKDYFDVIKVILPNSVKLGLTSLGAFLALQASMIIGSFYVPLESLASYGITIQAVNLIGAIGSVYYFSFVPKIGNLRVDNEKSEIKKLYKRSAMILLLSFIFCGTLLIFLGNPILLFLKSQTMLLNKKMILSILIITFLEKNHAIAGGFLLSNNEVPFFKASIISGAITVIALFFSLEIMDLGVWAMIIAPGIIQLAYQNWKWPLVLLNDLRT
ncbi:MAG: hypothetical protein GX361_09650 [Bacteroidales bacterium]|nr:hypothetical protein [Bacteroidales bacterium]